MRSQSLPLSVYEKWLRYQNLFIPSSAWISSLLLPAKSFHLLEKNFPITGTPAGHSSIALWVYSLGHIQDQFVGMPNDMCRTT